MATTLRCTSRRARASAGAALVAVAALAACDGNSRLAPSTTAAAPPQPSSLTTTAAARARRRSRQPPAAGRQLAGKTVVLDPGHNGGNVNATGFINHLVPAGRGATKPCNTTGTATSGGYTEAAFNWDLTLRLRRLLVARGAHVVLTRHSNTGVGPCVNKRAAIGNAAHADAVVAIHADGGPASGRGFQILYPPNAGETVPIFSASLRLAQALHRAILGSGLLPPSTYAGHNGYSQRSDLAGLNLSTRPAVFVELGNMANSTDAAIERDPGSRQALAGAIERGVDRFLGGGA